MDFKLSFLVNIGITKNCRQVFLDPQPLLKLLEILFMLVEVSDNFPTFIVHEPYSTDHDKFRFRMYVSFLKECWCKHFVFVGDVRPTMTVVRDMFTTSCSSL